MGLRDKINEKLLRTSGADVLSSREKIRKTLGAPLRPLYVRPVKMITERSFYLPK